MSEVKEEIDWNTEETSSQRVQLFREWQIHWYRWTMGDLIATAEFMVQTGRTEPEKLQKYIIPASRWLRAMERAAHSSLTNRQLMNRQIPEGFKKEGFEIPEQWREPF